MSSSKESKSLHHPVQKYLDMLSTSNDAASINAIVMKAFSDPKLFSGFHQIKSLIESKSQDKHLLNTLDLFSFGTLQDYSNQEPGTYVNLTSQQMDKLKALSVVTIIDTAMNSHLDKSKPKRSSRRNKHEISNSNSCNVVPYSLLFEKLGYNSQDIRSLEDLLIHCIYSNLLPNGTKLNQQNMQLSLNLTSSSTPTLVRDVSQQDVNDMICQLESFLSTSSGIQAQLQNSIKDLKQRQGEEKQSWNEIDVQIQLSKSKVTSDKFEQSSGSLEDVISTTVGSLGESMEWSKSGVSAGVDVKRARKDRGDKKVSLLGFKRK
ncbi:hypothetical protein CTEN210_00743 [Chaetoceros tenuissimus]|uniref:Uncharacterized protein n=1 Tax=Chaetoceros tenuissimus TaxID=426638 RepID=A0AAD3GZF1_9STRA|nr:hypothetical protein CTEN210_00743 [Chaetoceros tenuissimus]